MNKIIVPLLLLLILLSTPPAVVVAAEPLAKEPIGNCPAWMTAGPHVIYRCVDDDANTVLYQNDVGFMEGTQP